MRKYLIAITLLFIWIVTLPGIAQQYHHQYYDINEVLSKELIKQVVKDKEGYVWVATDEGILRFDGVNSRLFYKELPSPYTKAFCVRKNGNLLVLHDKGVMEIHNRPDTTVFKYPKVHGRPLTDTLFYPKSIFEDSKGNLWVGENRIVVKFDQEGVSRYDLGAENTSADYHRSYSFAEDAFGNLWMASYKGQLFVYNENYKRFDPVATQVKLKDLAVLENYKGDYLLLGGKEGLLQLKIDSDQQILSQQFYPEIKEVFSLVFTSENELFIGSWDQGLFKAKISEEHLEYYLIEEVPFTDIISLHYDPLAKELWIGGSENVGILKATLVHPVLPTVPYRIESLDISPEKQVHYTVGTHVYALSGNRTYWATTQKVNLSESYIDRLVVKEDHMWMASAFGQIFRKDRQTGQVELLLHDPDFTILHVYEDTEENAWFTGSLKGLLKIKEGQKPWYYPEVVNSQVVRQSPFGEVLCGGSGKEGYLYKYDKIADRFMNISLPLPFPSEEPLLVNDLSFGAQGDLWLATSKGLLKAGYRNGKYHNLQRVRLDGFNENEPVRAVWVSEQGIWLANSYGLVYYHNEKTMLFNRENGLPSKILKARGLVGDAKGNIWVATAKGVAEVQSPDSRILRKTPQPILQNLTVNGQKYSLSDTVQLIFPYNARWEVEYISLSYPGNQMVYQARILQLDSTWSKVSTNRNISVLGMSEGEYVLQVRSRKNAMLWSDPLVVPFTIATPWFKTWWAYLLFAFAFCGLILLTVKVYNFNLIRQKQRLREIIDARTQEINRQKNELIEQQKKIIQQKEELLEKNEALFKSQKALSEADLNFLHLKEKQLHEQVEYKNKQLTTLNLHLIQKNQSLKEMRSKLEELIKSSKRASQTDLKQSLKMIDESFRLDKDWEEFKLYFEQVYTGFYAKLKVNYPELTSQELRHCALIRLNLNIQTAASILGISPESIKVSRSRLRKKLNLPNNQNLNDFILNI
ncbi:hypothetical protein AAG747_14310 [Rapidithrix thailandica]|uniref:HTH luxR-type domain-containing protein n=1 Tax=Rapidithrix thailandica TaxID=413964 RepID=A0AAW9RZ85_9BACT